MSEVTPGSKSAFTEAGRLALRSYRGVPASQRTQQALDRLLVGIAGQRNATYHQVGQAGSEIVIPTFNIKVTSLLLDITGHSVRVNAEGAPHEQIIVEPGLILHPAGPEVASDIGVNLAVAAAIARLPDVLAGKAVSECNITFCGPPQARFGRTTPSYLIASFREGVAPLARIHARLVEKLLADPNKPPHQTALLLHGTSFGGPVVDELAAQLKSRGVLEGRPVSIQKVNPTQYPDDLSNEGDKIKAIATVLWGMGREQGMAELDPVKRAYEYSNLVFRDEIKPHVRSGKLREYPGATQTGLKNLQALADLFNLYRYLNNEDTHGVTLKTTLGLHDFSVSFGDRRAYILQAIRNGNLPIITERGSTYISTDASHYANNYDFNSWIRLLNKILH